MCFAVDGSDPPDALVFEHAADEGGLHVRRLDQYHRQVGQGSCQGHAVTPEQGE